MSQTYKITVFKGGPQSANGIPGPAEGTWTVSASSPAVALKRLLDGGHQDNLKFATVGQNRLQLDRGQEVAVRIKRVL
jgi:hypothetical protein